VTGAVTVNGSALGGATWGSISGDITLQNDLVEALQTKLSTSTPVEYWQGGTGLTAVGTEGTVLTVASGVPAWAPLVLLSNALSNTAGGTGTLAANTTGTYNTGFGLRNLSNNLSGQYNAAFGNNALEASTTATGNAAFGAAAMQNVTTGGNNVAVGSQAGYSVATGDGNVAVGGQAMQFVGTGVHSNIGIGAMALMWATGSENVAIGRYAMGANGGSLPTGSGNVALGRSAANGLISGSYGLFLGYGAGTSAAAGSNQIAIGSGAIATAANQMVLGGPNADLTAWDATLTEVIPGRNNTTTLGSSAKRWSTVYAGNLNVTGSITVNGSALGGAAWGGITGTLSDQTDLSTALGNKVATTTTVNGHALSGNVTVSASDLTTGTLAVANGGTGLSSFTAGDVLYASGTTTLAKLAKGTDGQVLTLSSGLPTWAAASGGGGGTWDRILPKSSLGEAGAAILMASPFDGFPYPFLHAYSPLGVDSGNTFLGSYAGNFTMSSWAVGNTGIGNLALSSLSASTTQGYASNNTALGTSAMFGTTTGFKNVAVGDSALNMNGTGSANTALGSEALSASSGIARSVAIGYQAGAYADGSADNTFVGVSSGSYYSGTKSLFLGGATGGAKADWSAGTNMIAIGYGAQAVQDHQMVLGNDGTAGNTALAEVVPGKTATTTLGSSLKRWSTIYASDVNLNGSSLAALAPPADATANTDRNGKVLTWDMTANSGNGGWVVAAAAGGSGTLDSDVGGNTKAGTNALLANTTGYYNSAFGAEALRILEGGSQNTSVGNNTLARVTTGNSNTGVGYRAGLGIDTGSSNVAIGDSAMGTIKLGSIAANNTAVGNGALLQATGNGNVALGTLAGNTLTNGSGCVFLGYDAGTSAPATVFTNLRFFRESMR